MPNDRFGRQAFEEADASPDVVRQGRQALALSAFGKRCVKENGLPLDERMTSQLGCSGDVGLQSGPPPWRL